MNSVTRSRLAWGIAIGSIVCAAGSMVFQAVVVGGSDDPALFVIAMIATVAYGFVGATIAARTGNAVGWALLSVIAAWAVSIGTQTYATYSYVDAARPLPLADFTAWVGTLAFFLTLALVL